MVRAAVISVSRTAIGTMVCLAITVLTAYPLSKQTLPGGKALMFLFFFTMVFIPGMIPTYLAVRTTICWIRSRPLFCRWR
jgi:ABC-type glycerol-3-phosphate transport system permease component